MKTKKPIDLYTSNRGQILIISIVSVISENVLVTFCDFVLNILVDQEAFW